MNRRQYMSALHAKQLRFAKDLLLKAVNRLMSDAREQGDIAKVAPQIQRLVGLDQYRERDVKRMLNLVSSPKKLGEYIVRIDPNTDKIKSGAAALQRAGRLPKGATNYSAVREMREAPAPAEESVVGFGNLVDTINKVLPDNTEFTDKFWLRVHELQSDPTSVRIETLTDIHPAWFSSGYCGEIGYGCIEMARENGGNLQEIDSAIAKLVAMEGARSVEERIRAAYEELEYAVEVATVGYKEQAGRAMQQILTILLPKSVRNKAMGRMMSSLDDISDDYDYTEE